jgi:hypothetical protein
LIPRYSDWRPGRPRYTFQALECTALWMGVELSGPETVVPETV